MLEQHKAAVQRIKDLNEAITSRKYDAVKEMLNDPKVAVNFGFSEVPLPLSVMYATGDPKIARLFLECERIDWLSPTWDRSMRNVREEFGIQYDPDDELINIKYPERKITSKFDFFYHLDESFTMKCQKEVKLVYERIFGELVKAEPSGDYQKFLIYSVNCWNAFQAALKYCDDVFVKNEDGQTLLHLTSSTSVSAFLIGKGLDPNARDNADWTPFMRRFQKAISPTTCITSGRELALLGANTTFVNKYGESALCSGISFGDLYLQAFDVTEDMFLNYLKMKRPYTYEYDPIQSILKHHPHLNSVFESNLPKHLLALGEYRISHYNIRRMTDVDYILYLKARLGKNFGSFSCSSLNDIKTRIKDTTNNYLHQPLKPDAEVKLYNYFTSLTVKKNPDTRPILFTADRYSTVNLIVWENADYSAEYNGLKFFEREEFESKLEEEDAEWLIALYKKGVDLFTPGKASGKSIIGHLNPEGNLKVGFERTSFLFPIAKISELFFEAFKDYETDAFAPIDDDGNCALHYLCSQLDGCVLTWSFGDLKKARNKAGRSAYDALLENDKNFDFGFKITSESRMYSYLDFYVETHGDKLFKEQGAKTLLKGLQMQSAFYLAEFLMKYYGVSMYSVICSKEHTKLISVREVFQSCTKTIDTLLFAVRYGYQLTSKEFFDDKYADVQFNFLDYCENPSKFIIEACENNNYYGQYPKFVAHPRFRNCPAPGAKNGLTLLEYYFFSICFTREQYNFYKQIGVNPKNSFESKCGLFIKFRKPSNGKCDVYTCLVEDFWTVTDFQSVFFGFAKEDRVLNHAYPLIQQALWNVIENLRNHGIYCSLPRVSSTCADCNDKFESFDEYAVLLKCGHIFHLDCAQLRRSRKEKICCICSNWIERRPFVPGGHMDDILGDKESCALCREDFQANEVLALLKCKHWFHIDCIENFSKIKVCPYCRTKHE